MFKRDQQSDYSRYRGNCKQFCDAAVIEDPTLEIKRGWFIDINDVKHEHWWTVRPDGTIHDPTIKQFAFNGIGGGYQEFDGTFECSQCGKVDNADTMTHESNYHFCDGRCYCIFVGVGYT
ncbi:hypothetical protein N9937_01480 [bacterium]|nr:hypothetical protein [bacterium]